MLSTKEAELLMEVTIATTVALHKLEELQRTRLNQQALKNVVNRTVKELKKKCESTFDDFEKGADKASNDVYNAHYDFLQTVGKVPLREQYNANYVLLAFKQNPENMLSIAKKILR